MKKNRLMTIIIGVVATALVCALFFTTIGSNNKKNNMNNMKPVTEIPILAYHKIVPTGTDFESGLLIAEDDFDAQMKYLHDNGFTTLTLDEFYDWYQGKDVPEKSVVITFDDGFYGTYYIAYPIIKKYEQAATVFCIGKNIKDTTDEWDPKADKDHYIGLDVIENMRKEYPRFTFESHTYDMHNKIDGKHPVKVLTYDQMMEDIKKNERCGFKYLAYPWGDHNDTIKKALKDSGYKMAFNYRPFYYATRDDDMYAINRIKISGKIKMKDFKRIVNLEDDECRNPDASD